jgi:hypothetical protein
MTVKERLHRHIEELSEQEAAEMLARIEWEASEEDELTDEEMAEVRVGLTELKQGQSVDGEQALRSLGL